jgi:putative ABC transport system permease protein
MALGSEPRHILRGVITEGAAMAAGGVVAGGAFGYLAARLAGSYIPNVEMPGVLPVLLSALVLPAAAGVASTWPAMRAARVEVIEALRSE